MQNILIVYPSLSIGGSTTSLLGMLECFDYTQTSVDLQLYENRGVYLEYLPRQINLLPQARIFSRNRLMGFMQRACRWTYWRVGIKSLIAKKKYPDSLAVAQVTAYARAETSRNNNKIYDVAIGYLEMWSDIYVLKKIQARKKIAWIHLDYQKAGLIPEYDRKMFWEYDEIILVSYECKKSFLQVFPELKDKVKCIENIISIETIKRRALEENINMSKYNGVQIGTVCRIVFRHKGLDRALKVLRVLKEEGYKFTWHIIGGGEDFDYLQKLIDEFNMNEQVILYGEKENPLPYIQKFDFVLLPSLFEGKPMVITEAQMLGIPAVVTRYASAHEQIQSGYNGLIMENSEEGILKGLRQIFDNPYKIVEWKQNLTKKTWDYTRAIVEIKKIVGELND